MVSAIHEGSLEGSNFALIQRIFMMLSQFNKWSIRHIPKEENHEVDHLVKPTHHRTLDSYMFETSPFEGWV